MTELHPRRALIKRAYRTWRAAKGLTQERCEQECRKHYPEMRVGRMMRFEQAQAFPTPSEVKALCIVLDITPEQIEALELDEASTEQQPAEARA